MDYEEKKLSKFNAGVALAERIDSLQRALNAARYNPLAYNFEVGKFNYEIMVISCDGLLNEVWSKLDEKERVYGERIRKLILGFMESNPITSTKSKDGEIKVNTMNFKKFMALVDLYEKTDKIFLDEHNLNSPNFDDDDGL